MGLKIPFLVIYEVLSSKSFGLTDGNADPCRWHISCHRDMENCAHPMFDCGDATEFLRNIKLFKPDFSLSSRSL